MKDLERKVISSNEWGLIALLHEGYLERLDEIERILKGESEASIDPIFKNLRDILAELVICFDGSTELGASLRDLYIFENELLTEGIVKKDLKTLQNARIIIIPLYEAFKELSEREDPNIVSGYTYGKGELNDSQKSSFDKKS